ncbi:hypothetical protein P3W53_01595 [Pseudomonas denitrificans (nom. rej.)]|nr:hypothetical protein [Pseudomonas denitrificans (nom. rej.)]
MDEILDFASVLMKLVLILLAVLMAGSMAVAPDGTLPVTSSVLMLVVPMFVLVTLVDLAGVLQSLSANKLSRKSSHHVGHD